MDINKVIIAEVQRYECLYNRELEEYRDNAYKDQVWAKIAKDIGISFQEVKRKYRNLRDTYIKSKRKINSTSNFIKPYKYSQRLQFLDRYYCKEMNSNSNSQHNSESFANNTNDTYSDSEFSTLKQPKLEISIENENNSWDEPLSPPPHLISKSSNVSTEVATTSASDVKHEDNENNCWEDPLSPAETSATTENTPIVINAASTGINSLKYRHKRKYKQKTNCTMQLFQCLANKITETNLTSEQRNAIENAVCNLVYGKIAEYTVDYGSSC